MDVLFTGNLTLISQALFDRIGNEYRCVVFGEKDKLGIKGKNVVAYWRNEGEDEISNVFNAFDFETVIFFSYALDGAKKVFDELEKLENVLYLCRKNQVKNVLYITSNSLFEESAAEGEKNSHFILREACESLCRNFSEEYAISVQILKAPYLYQKNGGNCQLSRWIAEAGEKGAVRFPGSRDFRTDFLCDEDLGELLARMLDEPAAKPFTTMHLYGKNGVTFEELGGWFRDKMPQIKVAYANGTECIPGEIEGKKARKVYGWYPGHVLREEIWEIFGEKQPEEEKRGIFWKRGRQRERTKERVRIFLELLIAFLAAELLNAWTKDNVIVGFIDFRLVFVVLMGTINGMNAGVAAAVLSCIGYVLSKRNETQWQIIFYNVQNWLPFACYFLLGSISGYTRDRHEDEVRYAGEEYQVLEDKYVFLNELYLKVLESKENFNSQIIGYKDSFGKMYSVVKKLDATLPEQVYYEAVNVLEEILGNSYVAIYSIDARSDFARLAVCSRNCNSELGKSLKITDYPVLLEALRANTTFVNREALPDYPAYATPVFRGEELVGMILLMHTEYAQMNMEFSNKFRIMTDLIRDSLIRAGEYYERNGAVLEDTKILDVGQFGELLAVKRQMRQKQYLDFTLLKIHQDGRSFKELSDDISGMVRNNDVLGLGEDGGLYLLLSQTKKEDMAVVAERMKKRQISFELVEG